LLGLGGIVDPVGRAEVRDLVERRRLGERFAGSFRAAAGALLAIALAFVGRALAPRAWSIAA
jgi:hypothetical protein